MDLEWRKNIVTQMIREDPEATIRDYLKLCGELQLLADEAETIRELKIVDKALRDVANIIREWKKVS